MAFQRNARFGIDVFIARDNDRFGGDNIMHPGAHRLIKCRIGIDPIGLSLLQFVRKYEYAPAAGVLFGDFD